MLQRTLVLQARQRGLNPITQAIAAVVDESSVQAGLCHLFVHHTSASIVIQENADPDVQRDLEAFFARLVPDGDPLYWHTDEGPDDMPAHVRSALSATSMTIPILNGRLGLGTWQGIYLWEHRSQPRQRRITVTIQD